MNEFRVVAKNGKFVGNWESTSEYTPTMMNELAKVFNVMYGNEWTLEYR